jgi:EAL domain-containing protein (putative c-di-GMP-specific phosphodiesterase class I)
VFAAGLQWLGEQHQRLAVPLNLHFNVAAPSLLDAAFVAFVEQELRANRSAAEKLFFECDANDVYDVVQFSRANLATTMGRLSAMGCRFVLDGASANTLAASRDLPFEYVKIDCRPICDSQNDRASLLSWQYTLEMSRALNKHVALKHVQRAQDNAYVNACVEDMDPSVQFVQGEYFDTPMPLIALTESTLAKDEDNELSGRERGANVLPQ